MPEPSNASVAAAAAALVAARQVIDTQLADWLAGSVDGGPNSDGLYPLTDSIGVTRMFPCWALLADTLSGPAGSAATSAATAVTAAGVAGTHMVSSGDDLGAVVLLRDQIETLLNQTRELRQQAASENAAARAEREACEAIKEELQALLDAASE